MSSAAFADAGLLAAKEATFFMPPQASTGASQVDDLFDLIFWLSAFFFALIVSVMVYFVVKYRHRPGHVESRTSSHNDLLEVTWSVIPALLTVVIFVQGVNSYLNLRQPPPNCYEIDVIANQWSWAFRYPNGVVSNELHFPTGRPVKLVMTSDDVLHSFFVPDFRVKMDLINGRYTYLWFQVDEPGSHDVYCTEYCGRSHSTMRAIAKAEDEASFSAWLVKEANYVEQFDNPVDAGKEVYKRRGCIQCHSVSADQKTIQGPGFYGTYGTQQQTSAGEVTVDENYIRESILYPQAKIRTGFKPQMPSFQGIVNDAEIGAMIAYIKSLNPDYHGDEVSPVDADAEAASGESEPSKGSGPGAEGAVDADGASDAAPEPDATPDVPESP